MNKKQIEKDLKSIVNGAKRDAMISAGAYDGRYRTRSVSLKKNKVKHKKSLYEDI